MNSKFLAVLISGLVSFNAVAQNTSQVSDATSRLVVQDAQTKTYELSTNGNYHLGGIAQFRYTYSNQDGENTNAYGFDIPRIRFDLTGKLDNDVDFRISPFIDSNGTVTLQDAWARKNYGAVGVRVGQFRPFLNAELNRGDEHNLAVERSIVSNTFGPDFTQGVEVSYALGSSWRVVGSFTDGWNLSNSPVTPANNGYAVNGRVEGSVYSSGNTSIVTGGGLSWSDNFQIYTGDVALTVGNLVTSLGVNYYTPDQGDNIQSAVVEAAYSIGSWQPFARYEYGHASNTENLSVASIGFNKDLVAHTVRWTTDVGYALNGVSSIYNVTNTGFSNSGHSGQYVLRSQITITF